MKRWQKFALTVTLWAVVLGRPGPAAAQGTPEGEIRFALYLTIAAAWLDPGEVTPGFFTPFWLLYGVHDVLVKPMPGNNMAPSLPDAALTISFGRPMLSVPPSFGNPLTPYP